MPILKNKIDFIKNEEKKVREVYGTEVTIINYGDPTPGPDYDPFYNTGLVRSKIEHKEKVLIYWISELELRELPVGGLSVGDVIMRADAQAKQYFQTALEQKNHIEFNGKKFVPHLITNNTLGTQINVFCSRIEDTNEGG